MQTPTFFRRGIFTDKENRTFSWYGNPDLLEEADITAVKVSSKYKPEYLLHRKRIWHRTILSGGVLVSPFVSPHEAKVRDWARENGGRFIIILDNGFPERFTPKGWMHDFCAQGRLLLIGPEEYQSESPKRGKSYWESMNKLAFEIAGEDFWEGY